MTLLSRKADYALLILSHLHHAGGGNARTIAERFGLSRPFVANILKDLCQKGFVTSHRGVKGGYALEVNLQQCTLGELLSAIDERFRLTICSSPEHPAEHCSLEQCCPVRGPLTAIHQRLSAVLNSVSLAEVLTPTIEARTLLQLNTVMTVPMTETCRLDEESGTSI